MASTFEGLMRSLIESATAQWGRHDWKTGSTKRKSRAGVTVTAADRETRRHRETARRRTHQAQHAQARQARSRRQRHHAQVSARR